MDEQFILASNALSSSQLSPPSIAAVSYTQNSKQSNRLVTAVPGVGVTFYDSDDQTPLSSITLGPSFRPTTSPVSRSMPSSATNSVRVKSTRKTWLGVESTGGFEIWSWIEDEKRDGSTEGVPTKLSFPLTDRVVALSAPRTLPTHLVLLSASGTLSLHSEASLTHLVSLPQSSSAPSSQSLQIYSINPAAPSPLITTSILSFLSTPSKAHLAIVTRTFGGVSDCSKGKVVDKKQKKKRPSAAAVIAEAEEEDSLARETTEIEVVLIDPEVMSEGITNEGIVSLGKVVVEGREVVVSEDGFVTALGPKGTLDSYRLAIPELAPVETYAELYSNDDPANLTLAPVKSLPLSSDALTLTHTTLLALHSSFVILATVRPPPKPVANGASTALTTTDDSAPNLTVLIWDTRLGAVVSSSAIPVPTAVFSSSSPSKQIQVSLAKLSNNMAALSVAPRPPSSTGTGGRSVIFILPLTLPSTSVLVAVIGKYELTQRFVVDTSGVVQRAKKAEPIRHPKTSEKKLAFLKESESSRATLLEKLEQVLSRLDGKNGIDGEAIVREAEVLFENFVEKETGALREYNARKVAAAIEKEKERREAALVQKAAVKSNSSRYREAKRIIDGLVSKAESEGNEWTTVTGTKIKGISDVHRYHYYDERKKFEGKLGKEVKDEKLAALERAMEKQKIALSSSFVAAILKLCFPKLVEMSTDIASPSTTNSRKHPAGIITYLLDRECLSDSIVEGGLTSYLARAGDWSNVQRALTTLPDIAESTSVALLRLVVHASATPSDPSPSRPPSLKAFLTSYVTSPTTPAILRQALQQQLSADEVLPVLVILDQWLGWWAMRGGGGGEVLEEGASDWKAAGKKAPKRLPSNPFVALTVELHEEEETPPRVEHILPLVQAIMDAHFVNLLLQRRAHPLLRRLSSHIAAHVAIQRDLSTLLGALSVFARTREEQKQASLADQSARDAQQQSRKKKRTPGSVKGVGSGGGAKEQQQSFHASMAARIAAQEKHNEVGAYEVDKFIL